MQLYHTLSMRKMEVRMEVIEMANERFFMPFYYDWDVPFSMLDGEDFKRLLLAMSAYHKDGTPPPEFEGLAFMVASFVFPQLEREKEAIKQRSEAGVRSGQARRKKKETA